MDRGQSELTDKIRSAIKKKLIEINAFVDNELPDYIMILVANKRSKAHMEKDLALFLGKDTADFTNWLWDLVNNLKVNLKSRQNGNVSKSDDETTRKDLSDEDADILDYDLGEQEGDLDQDDSSLDNRLLLTEHSEISKSSTVQTSASSESALTKNVNRKKASPKAKVYPVQAVARVHPSSMLKPAPQKINPRDEYGPIKSEFAGNVSSVVHVSQKNCTRPSLKANKLLLRAVDDATKSVLDGKSINDYYKPTPIKVLSPNIKESNDSSRLYNPVHKKINARLDLNSEIKMEYVEPPNFVENSNDSNVNMLENEHYIVCEMSPKNRTICLPTLNTDLDIDSLSSSFVEERSKSPHFIVTLDGVDFSSFKRKYSDYSDESVELDEEGLFATNVKVNDVTFAKKQKIIERCKYWPACKNNDNCVYHHPTKPCKSFPDCKYGDKCLYIHPNCKFDSLCTRKDCPFTHASKRTFQAQPPVPVKMRKSKIICKFYPKCIVKNCPFIHPKLCRYGTNCRLPVCPYSHINIPSRSQLKWKADASLNL
ncbi:zinc finger CCCH domain-containing protein 14-like [Argiope bruennichi]|uniref:zinc finger CCCH domain-containing protein 14-like n=1 Tax=Argiope bruennichi TaxID=94029 RepID=UPI002493D396|nr:zinc finger CCCH domain-containing protein 14-like [Argiope bruennichi]